MITYNKHVLLSGVSVIDTLILQEKLFSPLFSFETMFMHQKRQTWILPTIIILFMIGHHKHILLIAIHDTDALVLQEELFFFHLTLK